MGTIEQRKYLVMAPMLGACLVAMSLGIASAETKTKMQSAKLVKAISPAQGFIDDPFTFDSAGSRLLYVNSDAGNQASLVVVDAFQQTILARVNIAKFSLRPNRVEFAIDGAHYLVWGEVGADGRQSAGLIDSAGKIVRTFGPALDIVPINYQGVEALVVHDVSSLKKRKRGGDEQPTMRHTVGIYSVEKGRLLGKKSNLDLNDQNRSPSLDFSFKYWAENYTIAVGIKGGVLDRKTGQQSPDVEAWYTMPTRTFSKRISITNLIEHRQRMARLMKFAERRSAGRISSRDVVIKHNLSGIDFVENGNFTKITLAEPFHHYDSTSLITQEGGSGSLFFTLTIDPVHPDAAAKRRAVTPWVDLYEYDPRTKTATRRARMLGPRGRKHAWRANSRYWAVVPRHIGFERGGTDLLLYKFE